MSSCASGLIGLVRRRPSPRGHALVVLRRRRETGRGDWLVPACDEPISLVLGRGYCRCLFLGLASECLTHVRPSASSLRCSSPLPSKAALVRASAGVAPLVGTTFMWKHGRVIGDLGLYLRYQGVSPTPPFPPPVRHSVGRRGLVLESVPLLPSPSESNYRAGPLHRTTINVPGPFPSQGKAVRDIHRLLTVAETRTVKGRPRQVPRSALRRVATYPAILWAHVHRLCRVLRSGNICHFDTDHCDGDHATLPGALCG